MSPRAPEILVLTMDIGSSSSRTALFDECGHRISKTSASREYAVRYTADGGAELSPVVLREATARCLHRTLKVHHDTGALRKISIAAVGGSAFWHSLLGLDRSSRPVTPIYTWADSRCTRDAQRLRERLDEREIHLRTGCMLRASFWPAKLCWLRRTQPRIFRRVARWLSPGEWIFRELFGADACSHSMASATGLYNLREKKWDRTLRELCGVRDDQLSPIREIAQQNRQSPIDLRDAKIFTAIGDGAASNLGCGANVTGQIAINVGTSAAVRMIQPHRHAGRSDLPFGLFRYVVDEKRAVVGGAVSNAGNLRTWCLRELRLDDDPQKARHMLSSASAAVNEITVLPFWVNERAPSWPEGLRGTIVGVTQATSASDILHATTSSVFYRLVEILDLVESALGRAKDVIVSGGVLHSSESLRLLADAAGRDLEISREPEASLRGAALHALEQLGRTFTPLRKGKIIRYNRKLVAKHRAHRERQIALEKLLLSHRQKAS